MKECPFCREQIRIEAVKCRYCGSSLLPNQSDSSPPSPVPELDSKQVVLILDRGFLYFAKFVGGIVVIIVALATAYFGFDLNKAREDVNQMSKEVAQAQKEAKEAQRSVMEAKTIVVSTSDEAREQLQQTKEKLAETKSLLGEILARVQLDADKIHRLVPTSASALPEKSGGPQTDYATALTVPEIAALYHFPKTLSGKGETIGLIELGGGYRDSDLDVYFASLHLNRPVVKSVSIDHASNKPTGDPGSADGQVMLDIEVVGAVASSANIVVYFAPNTDLGFLHAVNSAINDNVNKPAVVTITWGGPESSWSHSSLVSLDEAMRTAAARGITIVAAAGDNGATDGVNDGQTHVSFPASSPWVLCVGGTRLTVTGRTIASEIVWNEGSSGTTGGGVSNVFATPDWQAKVEVPTRKDRSRGRGVPDVAAAADPNSGYLIRVDGVSQVVGGSSAAAELWAGLIILLNEGLGHNVGYLNPRLYQEIGPASVLNPIIKGNNTMPTLLGYSAAPGWNPVAGWGTPDGEKLLRWLRDHSESSSRK